METTFIVYVSMDSYEDYAEVDMFVTNDESKAKKWVDRVNKIVSENELRLSLYENEDCLKEWPLGYTTIVRRAPVFANYTTIEVR